MNSELLEVIKDNIDTLVYEGRLTGKYIVVFGMNHPGDFIINYLAKKGVKVNAVIDNNPANKGTVFESVPVTLPVDSLSVFNDSAAVLICSRYYAEMRRQLENMGYIKDIHIFRLLDMDGSGDFSLDADIFNKKADQAVKGAELADKILRQFNAESLLICPVKANGDVYLACSFLRAYLTENDIGGYALAVIGEVCGKVAGMFGYNNVYIANQEEIDCLTIAYRMLADNSRIRVLQPFWNYTSFINRLDCYRGLNFFDYFKHWVFGLGETAESGKPYVKPDEARIIKLFERNRLSKSSTVIIVPYANSLHGIHAEFFEKLAAELKRKGYCVATNISGKETAIPGTAALNFPLDELIPVAEYAGSYIGIRNGLSEIVSSASCRKVIICPLKACAFGTAKEFFSISELCGNSAAELTYDGNIEECIQRIMEIFPERDLS